MAIRFFERSASRFGILYGVQQGILIVGTPTVTFMTMPKLQREFVLGEESTWDVEHMMEIFRYECDVDRISNVASFNE